MNCIDAIEGNVKQIISKLHGLAVSERFEDTEYIRSVKIILEATDTFLSENREITDEPGILQAVLLAHAREQWIKAVTATPEQDIDPEQKDLQAADREYLTYYFDSIYHKGRFPL